MSDDNEIRHGRHCVFKMHVHLVFVAKYRRRVFDGDAISRLRTIFAKVCADFHRAAVHRTTEDTSLKLKDGYAVRAILPRPGRRGLSRTGSGKCERNDPYPGAKGRVIMPPERNNSYRNYRVTLFERTFLAGTCVIA